MSQRLRHKQVATLFRADTSQEVFLNMPFEQIVSRSSKRVNCELCGEEAMNERKIRRDGLVLCRTCAGEAYYHLPLGTSATVQG